MPLRTISEKTKTGDETSNFELFEIRGKQGIESVAGGRELKASPAAMIII